MKCRGKALSLSLDLYGQWETMEKDGKWRFTSPTHAVLAFAQALREMEAEGGIEARSRRYAGNNRLLIKKLAGLGIRPYIGNIRAPSSPPFSTQRTAAFPLRKCTII